MTGLNNIQQPSRKYHAFDPTDIFADSVVAGLFGEDHSTALLRTPVVAGLCAGLGWWASVPASGGGPLCRPSVWYGYRQAKLNRCRRQLSIVNYECLEMPSYRQRSG